MVTIPVPLNPDSKPYTLLTLQGQSGLLDLGAQLLPLLLGRLGLRHRLLQLLLALFEQLLGSFQLGPGLLQLVLGGFEPLAALLGEVADLTLQALEGGGGAQGRWSQLGAKIRQAQSRSRHRNHHWIHLCERHQLLLLGLGSLQPRLRLPQLLPELLHRRGQLSGLTASHAVLQQPQCMLLQLHLLTQPRWGGGGEGRHQSRGGGGARGPRGQ